jgi:DNA polymerase I
MARIVCIDCETAPIIPGLAAPPLACMALSELHKPTQLYDEHEAVRVMHELLDNPQIIVTNHNLAFDMAVMSAADKKLLPKIFQAYADGRMRCTYLREALLQIKDGDGINAEASLDDLSRIYLQRTLDKNSWRLKYGELRLTPMRDWPEGARKYPMDDTDAALGVFYAQQKRACYDGYIDGENAVVNEKEQAAAAFALELMSVWGPRTDAARVAELKTTLAAQYEMLAQKLFEAGLMRKKRDGSFSRYLKAIHARVEASALKNAKEVKLTEKGRICANSDVLKQSNVSEALRDPALKMLAEYGGIEKQFKTYVPSLELGAHVPVSPHYIPLIETGRYSCRRPNLLNPPRKGGIRECYVPRAGKVFGAVDYPAIELRVLAQDQLDMFGRSALASAFQAGLDPHLCFAAALQSISYEEALWLQQRDNDAIADRRQLAKAFNFGCPGGLGEDRFTDFARMQYDVIVPPGKFWDYKRTWLKQYPEMQLSFNLVNKQLGPGGRGAIELLRSKRIRGGVGFTDGCNYRFQGPTADGAKRALFHISWECYVNKGTALYGSRPQFFLYDESILEHPEEDATERVARQCEVMVEQMKPFIPDIPLEVEGALMRRWYKKAKPVRDATGRLVPWEPKPKAAPAEKKAA